jgi:(1->4)-alpha-D-glucan 1-alpha-D-glucosylmutase
MQIPTATYRLQLSSDFGFKAAGKIAPYLSRLGISHIYASPIFAARKGSSHGYDGVDANRLNRELGTDEDFDALSATLRDLCMGWVQDIVPNHLAYDFDNRRLMDVLENGPASRYAPFFDIDWDHPDPDLRGRVLAPFLGTPPEEAVQNGEIRFRYDADGFAFTYYDLAFPVAIPLYRELLEGMIPVVKKGLGDDHPDAHRFIDVRDGLEQLTADPGTTTRHAQVEALKKTLWGLYSGNDTIRRAVDDGVMRINGSDTHPPDPDTLHQLLSRQFYRLDHWQTACRRLNYRRFFTINDLISVCQEDESVFVHTHALIARLVDEAIVTGVRIDHVDGMADPTLYLNRLRERLGDVYLLVEKILDPDEPLPPDWPVQGTTGYEFTQALNGLFIPPENEARFSDIYTRFTGLAEGFDGIVAEGKRRILSLQMAGDLDNLVRSLKAAADPTPDLPDPAPDRLKEALAELLVRFPVYRTYIGPDGLRETDRSYLLSAAEQAVLHQPDLRAEIDFIRKALLGEFTPGQPAADPSAADRLRDPVRRFQQLTAPLMAKGYEDTALYVYNRLVSLNGVGGDPGRFGTPRRRFHDTIGKRALTWPHAMNSTATHDGKRGEDVRARINVLSEIPDEWEQKLAEWHGINQPRKERIGEGADAREVPDANEEYLLYQTLLGAWEAGDGVPSREFIDRMTAYAVKAAKEAKVNTSWMTPHEPYETALAAFVERILTPGDDGDGFIDRFLPFRRKIAHYGFFNSLSQTLIKIAAPGVPDFYQGTEWPDLNLVDPDNRRAVDFERRARMLDRILAETAAVSRTDPFRFLPSLLTTPQDGRAKLFLINRALKARNDRPALFQQGDYLPMTVEGPRSRHIVAFARRLGGEWALAVAPRFLTRLVAETESPLGDAVWKGTVIRLPDDRPAGWTNALTGEEISGDDALSVGDILRHFPVGLLVA